MSRESPSGTAEGVVAPPPRPPPLLGDLLPRSRVLAWILLPALAAWLLFVGSRVGLATSTETRYAEIGREMRVSGDLVIPTLNGAPHLEKPPLTYWALAGAFLVAGANDVAARLPGLLAAAIVLAFVAAAGRRWAPSDDLDPRGRGTAAALVLATMPSFLFQTYLVMTDTWLVVFSTLAGIAVVETVRAGGRPAPRFVLLLHAALGLGMLVKGPAVLVTPVVGAVVASIASRNARMLRPFVLPYGLLLFAAISLPWYLVANARLPGLLELYVSRRAVEALSSSAEFHEHGPWVVWIPLLGTAPWVAAVPGALRALWSSALLPNSASRRAMPAALVAMALAAPLVFSLGASRLVSYGMPAVPWVALIVVTGSRRGATIPGERRSFPHLLVASRATLAAAGALLASAWFVPVRAASVPLVAAAVGGMLLALALTWRITRAHTALGACLAGVAMCVGFNTVTMASPESFGAERHLYETLAPLRTADDDLGVAINRDGAWGFLPFYAGKPVRFFGYAPRLTVPSAVPAEVAPESFRSLADLEPWFRAPERRWLLLRTTAQDNEKGPWARLGAGPVIPVASDDKYSLVTNLPLAK